mgnify:FL=1
MFYYRARWYDPQARRFISEDPIGLDGGINLYAYVENNPLNMVDPYGNWGWLIRLGQWASQTPAGRRASALVQEWGDDAIALAQRYGRQGLNAAQRWGRQTLDAAQRYAQDIQVRQLCKTDQKTARSLINRVAEHKQKLADYISDPFKYDNQNLLRTAPSDAIRKQIIDGRNRHLQHEIDNWEQQIKNLLEK